MTWDEPRANLPNVPADKVLDGLDNLESAILSGQVRSPKRVGNPAGIVLKPTWGQANGDTALFVYAARCGPCIQGWLDSKNFEQGIICKSAQEAQSGVQLDLIHQRRGL